MTETKSPYQGRFTQKLNHGCTVRGCAYLICPACKKEIDAPYEVMKKFTYYFCSLEEHEASIIKLCGCQDKKGKK